MRLHLIPFLAATAMLAPLAASAEGTPVVLELFTSQGCSSCPPADALLTELARQEGVIALALHVDYWDYLGWKDDFADPANTARQKAYAKAARSRSIYTPEMVVQGNERVKGHDAERIAREIARYGKKPPQAELALSREGDTLSIHLAPTGAATGPADIHLVSFTPSQEVAIDGGENAGLDLTYTNIVTDWETIARWDGSGPVDMRYEGLEPGPVAVIVQRSQMGQVLTAATAE
jgi:hypothetical protein